MLGDHCHRLQNIHQRSLKEPFVHQQSLSVLFLRIPWKFTSTVWLYGLISSACSRRIKPFTIWLSVIGFFTLCNVVNIHACCSVAWGFEFFFSWIIHPVDALFFACFCCLLVVYYYYLLLIHAWRSRNLGYFYFGSIIRNVAQNVCTQDWLDTNFIFSWEYT